MFRKLQLNRFALLVVLFILLIIIG
ncbi:YjcZ family sporulation protein [Bacillus cereus]|nr:hypothetical protein COJ13_16175 [Bacillus cereus]TKH55752.1 YjcZ family sporulation protein [Bacillus cereus]